MTRFQSLVVSWRQTMSASPAPTAATVLASVHRSRWTLNVLILKLGTPAVGGRGGRPFASPHALDARASARATTNASRAELAQDIAANSCSGDEASQDDHR